MLRNSILIIVILVFAAASVYLYFGINYRDAIDARRPESDDKYFIISMNELKKDNFQFFQLAGRDLMTVKISGKSKICYFFYSKKPISINDSDFLYCFDRKTGAILERM